MWGSASTDVVAVGQAGTILHYDGVRWVTQESGTTRALRSAWGSSGADIFAVGEAGTVLHFDGTAWAALSSNTTADLRAVWGRNSTDVYAVGDDGTLLHYDGTAWSAMTGGGVGDHYYCVWGDSTSAVFAAGWAGTILLGDGTHWVPMTSGETGNLRGMSASPGGGKLAVGQQTAVLRGSDRAWTSVPLGPASSLNGVWMRSLTDAFAVGAAGGIQRWNGTAWTPMVSGTYRELWGVWGQTSAAVFAVGDAGTVLRYDGATWGPMASGTDARLRSVWGASESQVFSVGAAGTILRFDGTSWQPMVSGTTESLGAVWGSSATDVFAVGDSGTIVHFDGVGWTPMARATTHHLAGVWGSSATEVFAVGAAGTLLYYDGAAWTALPSPTVNALANVWGSDRTDVHVVGDAGTILHYAVPADLALTMSHDQPFVSGGRGVWTLSVTNRGPHSTVGPVRIEDVLPAGVSVVSAVGTHWACHNGVGDTTCVRSESLAVGASSDVRVEVTLQAAGGTLVTNTAVVQYAGDSTNTNDTAAETVEVGLTPPTVTGVAPASGSTLGGTSVTISGTGFVLGTASALGAQASAPSAVTFGSIPAREVVVLDETTIMATTPMHAAGAVDVVVTNPDGQLATMAGAFAYVEQQPAPTVTRVEPSVGPTVGGTQVTVTGADFDSMPFVTFGGLEASVVTGSRGAVVVMTPAHAAGAVDVVVTNSDGQGGSLPAGFTYGPTSDQHPADTTPDWNMSIGEVTAYAGAWRAGDSWPHGPVPIPIAFVTRAAYLWREGEAYHYVTGTCPGCWMPNRVGGDGESAARVAEPTADDRARITPADPVAIALVSGPVLPGATVTVRLQVLPPTGTAAWAAEEHVPPGWIVGAVDARGASPAGGQVIRWGPFYSDAPRTLSYVATVPTDAGPLAMFRGVVSVDGADWEILGGRRVAVGPRPTAGDYDGDGRSDHARFNGATGVWTIAGRGDVAFGRPGDWPVPADYDGDGRTDVAVYRPSTGLWAVEHQFQVLHGAPGMVPVPGDYDGDGRADVAVYDPATGCWDVFGGARARLGRTGEVPVPADYDGDGATDVAFFNPTIGAWRRVGERPVAWGIVGDVPVPADYDGDGAMEWAVFRPGTGMWLIAGHRPVVFGETGDVPAPADHDGDGIADLAMYRAAGSVHLVLWR